MAPRNEVAAGPAILCADRAAGESQRVCCVRLGSLPRRHGRVAARDWSRSWEKGGSFRSGEHEMFAKRGDFIRFFVARKTDAERPPRQGDEAV